MMPSGPALPLKLSFISLACKRSFGIHRPHKARLSAYDCQTFESLALYSKWRPGYSEWRTDVAGLKNHDLLITGHSK